jgi:hypothetical protein
MLWYELDKLGKVIAEKVARYNKENNTNYSTLGLYAMGYTEAELVGWVVGLPRNIPVVSWFRNGHIKRRSIEVKPAYFLDWDVYEIVLHEPALKQLAEEIASAFRKNFPQYKLEVRNNF